MLSHRYHPKAMCSLSRFHFGTSSIERPQEVLTVGDSYGYRSSQSNVSNVVVHHSRFVVSPFVAT